MTEAMVGWSGVVALAALDVALWVIVHRTGESSADRRLQKCVARQSAGVRPHPSLWARIGGPLLHSAAACLRPLASPARRGLMVDRLMRAGLEWDPALFDGLKLAGAVVGAAVAVVVGSRAVLPGGSLGWMVVAAGVGYLLPVSWLRHRGEERQRQFRRALPDALDVFAICLRAGLGLHAAVAEYARSAFGVAAEAFRRYLSDVALGRPPEEGLAELARRYPGEDLASVAVALAQGTRFGSPVAEILEEQAAHCRAIALRQAQEDARALSTRLVLPLVVFVFPQIFIVGLGPVALHLFGSGGVLRSSP